ncbi:uncharacterized protein LOC108481471 [Gossypium arboreum]|uniref:uncharacterized protein LOC108481471 n=1 Tax=Gossypium arboreum TaxID=29729 RepID=UPI00081908FD|nr:uncharacterized protein LOC108481471 [Gossypium arboreum]
MKEEETVKQYSDRIMVVVNSIRLLGEQFSEARIAEKVISTLLESYEAKISSLEDSRDLTSISLIELINALYAQKQRRASRLEEHQEGAFQAKTRPTQTHLPTRGSKPRKTSLEQNGERRYPPCPSCRRMGHADKVCKNKGKQRPNQPQQPRAEARVAEESSDQEEQVFAVSCSATKRKDIKGWLIDSDCTNHMTPDAGIFKTIDRSFKTNVKVGNGHIIKAEGKDYLISDVNGSKLMTVTMADKSFVVDWNKSSDSAYIAVQDESKLWHKRLGHVKYNSMTQLTKEDLVENFTNSVEKE